MRLKLRSVALGQETDMQGHVFNLGFRPFALQAHGWTRGWTRGSKDAILGIRILL